MVRAQNLLQFVFFDFVQQCLIRHRQHLSGLSLVPVAQVERLLDLYSFRRAAGASGNVCEGAAEVEILNEIICLFSGRAPCVWKVLAASASSHSRASEASTL